MIGMTNRLLEIHPTAVREIRKARRWYQHRSKAVADRFVRELDLAVTNILAHPESFPDYLLGTKAYLFRRFPYVIIYSFDNVRIKIFAVAHGSRRPGYWKRRLP
jgi:plasmid stabilization system protein ParE